MGRLWVSVVGGLLGVRGFVIRLFYDILLLCKPSSLVVCLYHCLCLQNLQIEHFLSHINVFMVRIIKKVYHFSLSFLYI